MEKALINFLFLAVLTTGSRALDVTARSSFVEWIWFDTEDCSINLCP